MLAAKKKVFQAVSKPPIYCILHESIKRLNGMKYQRYSAFCSYQRVAVGMKFMLICFIIDLIKLSLLSSGLTMATFFHRFMQ